MPEGRLRRTRENYQQPAPNRCLWTTMLNDQLEPEGLWQTHCGAVDLNGPADGAQFCAYCGKAIELNGHVDGYSGND